MTKIRNVPFTQSLVFALALTSVAALASGGKAPSPDREPKGPDLTQIAVGGTACSGASTIRVVGDQSKIGVEFKDFIVETEGDSTLAREACSVAIPLHVPAGWQLVVDTATVRGVARLHQNHRATIRLDLFTAGTRGPSITQDIVENGAFEIALDTNDASRRDAIATVCGPVDVNLRANLSARVTGAGSKVHVKTLGDAESEGIIGFKWRKCL